MINKKFNKIIELILKYINEGYVILLESDLVSLMFHSYLLLEENIPNKIHINSRISQSKSDREKIDFVIGEIINPKKLRPKIEPEIIVEVKAIPELGFNDRQKEKRYQTIIQDIKKIKNLNLKVPRYILIFDGVNYFEDKIEMIIQERNTVDTGIELIRIYKTNSKYFAENY
ncbi:MAG: hypothetical protein A2057_01960 [Ignavibacteria bacterium GWA2_35_9]|nr:MAG: hypothetical protein A2057_01960 [Ignavibacteria bacterium GWA2_35_9]OGU43783.1 MAG: hypothetical protein A2000_17475 [Ignavibacteria bacterium GWB2_36_8]OGU50309.1 MAG: hypothetical protein A2080_00105 [Ignavibacteria bacterium GWC2_36_12]